MNRWRTVVDGGRTFVTIGAVAEALRRDVQTIRRFERQGILPKPRYRLMSPHPPGQRRLYTLEQVRLLERAAWATGLVGAKRPTAAEIRAFAVRAHQVFADLAGTAQEPMPPPAGAPGPVTASTFGEQLPQA